MATLKEIKTQVFILIEVLYNVKVTKASQVKEILSFCQGCDFRAKATWEFILGNLESQMTSKSVSPSQISHNVSSVTLEDIKSAFADKVLSKARKINHNTSTVPLGIKNNIVLFERAA